MADKRHLVIDMGRGSVRGGVFSDKGEMLARLSNVYDGQGHHQEGHQDDQHGQEKAALSSLLGDLAAQGYTDFSRILVGLPQSIVSTRMASLPFLDTDNPDRDKLEEVLSFEVGESLIGQSSDMLFSAVTLQGDGGRTMALAVTKDELGKYMDMFQELGIEPEWAGPSLYLKHRLFKTVYQGSEVAAFLDGESLVVVNNGKPQFFKVVNDEIDLRLAIACVEAPGVEVTRFYCIDSRADMVRAVTGKDPMPIHQIQDEEIGIRAIATQLSGELDKSLNLRRGQFADLRSAIATNRGMSVALVLLAALAVLWSAHLFQRSTAIDSEAAEIKQIMASEFRAVFPGQKVVVDASYQMETRLKALRDEKKVVSSALPVLELMTRLSEAANKEDRVQLYRLALHGQRVAVKGQTLSFEKAARFKDAVSNHGSFGNVVLTDVKARAVGGGVKFSLAANTVAKGVEVSRAQRRVHQ